jgi:hypothetical protein
VQRHLVQVGDVEVRAQLRHLQPPEGSQTVSTVHQHAGTSLQGTGGGLEGLQGARRGCTQLPTATISQPGLHPPDLRRSPRPGSPPPHPTPTFRDNLPPHAINLPLPRCTVQQLPL